MSEGDHVSFVQRGELVQGAVIMVGNGSTANGDALCLVRVDELTPPVPVRASVIDGAQPEGMLW